MFQLDAFQTNISQHSAPGVVVKNANAKAWTIVASSDGLKWSNYPAGDKPAGTYSTTFATNQNPLSEGGVWATTTCQSKTPVQVVGGKAYGTMFTFDNTNYNDSCACINSWTANDQRVTATLSNTGIVAGLEAELLLRCTFDSSHALCYELDIVYATGIVYLVRWNFVTGGPPDDYTHITDSTAGNPNVSFADGAVYVFQIVGTVITAKCNGATIISYDTAGDSVKYSTGKPGIGFWNETGSSANTPKLAWADFLAESL